ncbi:MAG TPA: ATP-binding protein [Anaerolineaceae bacterium]|nr:ATP-binding protein [Anaerolineaceae bacterium]
MLQLFGLFVAPPGSLIYYLVLAFIIVAALQIVLIGRQGDRKYSSRRTFIGLALLLAGQVVLFIVSGLAWQTLIDSRLVVPPLDRAVTVFGLLWITWLWAFPASNRLADAVAGVLSLVIVIAYGFTYNNWVLFPVDTHFNATALSQVWEIAALAVILGGLLLLLVRRPDGWGMGLSMLLVNLAGHLFFFFRPDVMGDYAGVVRLAQVCSFPLLPILAQRSLLAGQTPPTLPSPTSLVVKPPFSSVVRERRRFSADPRAVFDWLQLAVLTEKDRLYAEFTRAFAQTLMADLCFLVRAPDPSGKIEILSGYDLIHEEYLKVFSLSRDSMPAIANALQKGRAMRLGPADSSSADLTSLANAANLGDPGNLMLVPLASPPVVWGAILALSPYSKREWTSEDQDYLLSSVDVMVTVLQQAGQVEKSTAVVETPSEDLSRIRRELNQAASQLEEMKAENRLLLEEIALIRNVTPPDLESLLAVQKESQDIITSLQEENDRLREVIRKDEFGGVYSIEPAETPKVKAPVVGENHHLEEELRQALEQVAHLQNSLAESNIQLLELQKMPRLAEEETEEGENKEVINALVQELRQPMASITGYTDLLLAESAGLIGALQRNFLERVKSSIERMQSILNDLVQTTALQNNPPELEPRAVHTGVVIDEAVAAVSAQVRAKNITLRVDLPDELPEIRADRDAIQQVVVHLLQNAGSATPVEGSISLRALVQPDDRNEPAILLQVTDSGGGIASEDLPRVFSRRYRADNPLIQGVGDTGVGLSIAKTLVEAHHGRIWVESVPGQSSTFSILLPVNPASEQTAAAS